MANAELKTKKTAASVDAYLDGLDAARRDDCRALVAMMRAATGAEPRMWGDSMIGFGDYHYVYASGRENDWFEVGFAPRKNEISLYITCDDLQSRFGRELARLGKHRTGRGCLYVKRLADVDFDVLRGIVERAVTDVRKKAR